MMPMSEWHTPECVLISCQINRHRALDLGDDLQTYQHLPSSRLWCVKLLDLRGDGSGPVVNGCLILLWNIELLLFSHVCGRICVTFGVCVCVYFFEPRCVEKGLRAGELSIWIIE